MFVALRNDAMPADTRYCISRALYAQAQGRFPEDVDLGRLGVNGAQAIHRHHWWNAIQGDRLPAGFDLMLYDAAVCHDTPRAVIWLQSILRTRQDGEVSERTLTAINAYVSRYTLVSLINTYRKERLWQIDRSLEGHKEARDIGAAMRNRIEAVTKKACGLAGGF